MKELYHYCSLYSIALVTEHDNSNKNKPTSLNKIIMYMGSITKLSHVIVMTKVFTSIKLFCLKMCTYCNDFEMLFELKYANIYQDFCTDKSLQS